MRKITYLQLLQMVRRGEEPRLISTEKGGVYAYKNGPYRHVETNATFDYDPLFRYYSTYGHAKFEFITILDGYLDDAEKKYLGAVIKPFKNRVQEIVKASLPTRSGEKLEYIQIVVKTDSSTTAKINFPAFPKDKMYKGMEADRGYTVEELGL